jgi:signal transduction histidine kinase
MDEHGKALAAGTDPAAAQQAVETMRKGWKIVEKNQERISTLVLDMLTFSKEREPEPEAADLNEVVGDVIEMMQSRANEHTVELLWQPTELMPTLMFDSEAIHRAVLNVVTNAIDACDACDPARVEVRTSFDSASNLAAITVQDTGIGIDKDDLQKIFTVFVSKKGGRGTGLGLPVSQKILQEHGGRIRVTSEPGQGSTFTLEFPAHIPGVTGGDPGDSVRADAGPTLAGQV